MKLSSAAYRFFKFCTVGVSGVVVNAGLLHLFTETASLNYKLSSLIAIECAICNNFLWNSLWTWRDRKIDHFHGIARSFIKFNLSSGLVALVINWGVLVALTELCGVYYQISNLVGIALGTCANFLLSHFWAFSNPLKRNGANES
jgi:dolichol-phosphate mannosyltransferase